MLSREEREIQNSEKKSSRPPPPPRKPPRVFVVPVFEISWRSAEAAEREGSRVALPKTKFELAGRVRRGGAVPFHKTVCRRCHKVPGERRWEISVVPYAWAKFSFHFIIDRFAGG